MVARVLTCAVVVCAAASSGGCGSGSSSDPVARAFLTDWSRGNGLAAGRLTTAKPATVAAGLSAFSSGLGASKLRLRFLGSNESGRHAVAHFAATVHLAGLARQWRYTGALHLTQAGGHWRVVWMLRDLHPSLRANERIITVRTLPPRAPLLDRTGVPLQRPTPVVTVGVVPGLLKPRARNIAILARTLQIDGPALAETVARFSPQDFLPVITIRRSAYERVRAIIHPLEGVHFQTGVLPLGPTSSFGRAVLGQVGPATANAIRSAGPLALPSDDIGLNGLQLVYQRRLAGAPSGRVELVDSTGRVRSTLFSVTGRPGSPVHATLDLRLQRAAESALPKTSRPAALVAIQASTGQILAVANRPADSTYDVGLDGSYPPGSTFKVVTTAALLARGFDPSSRVTCPPSITIDGKRFTNYAGESAAGASFLEDFAKSCNDAFISLAPRLRPGDIAAEAGRFGFGSRWTLPLTSYSGQAPPPRNAIDRAADMIGQGNIVASPLNMALVAAAIDTGTWRPPSLVLQPRPVQRTSPHAIDPASVSELHRLMRAVVTSGTGTAADLPGAPVFGKTGTAEFGSGNPPATDAWFIGFRGEIAFAVVVQGGGVGGLVAAPIAARFLRAAGS
ncbi:MAG: penicillin-binding transpeptidase domain-containing protein [Solirubrobacteraceae bacterium]